MVKDDTDRDLITLTHVCRSWRTIFTSRPSLWSYLDCSNIDKTRTYIERSKTAPLEICVKSVREYFYIKEAFLLAVPHIGRLKCLSIFASNLPGIIHYFFCHAPLLEELDITLYDLPVPVLSDAFLDGNLPSLRDLRLTGVITSLPWKNLSNLTTFHLCRIPTDQVSTTQLLNFFENAPFLRIIELEESIPNSSNAPPGRIVSLSSLKKLTIIAAQPTYSILLNHLSIPSGSLLVLEFDFSRVTSPVSDFLPKPSENIDLLSEVTTINLLFEVVGKYLRLDRPNGETYVFGHHVSAANIPSHLVDRQILRSIDKSILSTTRKLAISKLNLPPFQIGESQTFLTLRSMKNLRTLVLTKCHNLPFILALNPGETPSNLVICPKLKDLVLYTKEWNGFHIPEMLSMAEERASRDAKLSSVTIVGLGELVPGKEAFKLRKYVGRVDYRVDDAPPDWDDNPSEGDETE